MKLLTRFALCSNGIRQVQRYDRRTIHMGMDEVRNNYAEKTFVPARKSILRGYEKYHRSERKRSLSSKEKTQETETQGGKAKGCKEKKKKGKESKRKEINND